jgi:hypothetical protein
MPISTPLNFSLMLWGMAPKKRSKVSRVILPDQLRIYLTLKMQAAKLNGIAYAAKIGFAHQTLYAVMNGKRSPPKGFLSKIGLTIAYRIPGSDEVISPEDVRVFLTVKMQMEGMDAKKYADKLGEHDKTIWAVLAGTRPASKSLIKKLDLETVYQIF